MNYRVCTDKTQWEISFTLGNILCVRFFNSPEETTQRVVIRDFNNTSLLGSWSFHYVSLCKEQWGDDINHKKIKVFTRKVPVTSAPHLRRVFWRWIPVKFRFEIHQAMAIKALEGHTVARYLLDAERDFLKQRHDCDQANA